MKILTLRNDQAVPENRDFFQKMFFCNIHRPIVNTIGLL